MRWVKNNKLMLVIQPTPFSDGHLLNTDIMYFEFVIAIFNHFLCHLSSDTVFWSKWFPNQEQVVFSWILIFGVLILNTIYLSLWFLTLCTMLTGGGRLQELNHRESIPRRALVFRQERKQFQVIICFVNSMLSLKVLCMLCSG